MAILRGIEDSRKAIRLSPGRPPAPASAVTGGNAWSDVGGEYKYISGVLHALYRSGGLVWLRIGEEDILVRGPLRVRCDAVSKDVLRATIPLECGRIITVDEPIPPWVHTDPAFDHLSAVATLWGCMVQDWLEDEASFQNRWGFARDLD